MLQPLIDSMTRRSFLSQTVIGTAACSIPLAATSLLARENRVNSSKNRPRVAIIYTELRFRSHAYNFIDNFLEPYMFRGELVDPGVDVVSLYADQFPNNDMSRDFSRQFKIPLYPSIDQALCLGGKELAVDAVLLIGEHGDYPLNARGQRMYPRKKFFDEIVAVMRRSKRAVPLFNDKHLSYRWDWAKEMYDVSKDLGFPMQAGSSVPLGQRIPAIDVPAGTEIEEAVSIHGGGMESYDFHALEVLQSFVEFRKGGEAGISKVELLTGDKLQQAAKNGRWSQELAKAAMSAEAEAEKSRQERPDTGRKGSPVKGNPKIVQNEVPEEVNPSHAIILTYQDGFRASILKVGSSSNRWNFACKVRGQKKPLATAIYNGPWGNRCLFKALSHAIQHLVLTGKEPYPIERTLLVSGILDAAMQSHENDGRPIETPHLGLSYQPIEFSDLRENGKSWERITAEVPQPISLKTSDESLIVESDPAN